MLCDIKVLQYCKVLQYYKVLLYYKVNLQKMQDFKVNKKKEYKSFPFNVIKLIKINLIFQHQPHHFLL